MIEKPPILQGNTGDQVRMLRDYLYRLAGTLDGTIQQATTLQNVKVTVDSKGRQVVSAGGGVNTSTAEAIKKSADELKSLIIKSADETYEYMDAKTEEYDGKYVAQSEYGTFVQNINSTIETTAKGVIEAYQIMEEIDGLHDEDDALSAYMREIQGQIKRGIILDPSTNDYVVGIAISQTLDATTACRPGDAHHPGGNDQNTYYYIEGEQTFGLYTSTGWQFWIGGRKVGWFDSVERVLNVYNLVVKETLRIGKAEFDMSTRFDIKPIGV